MKKLSFYETLKLDNPSLATNLYKRYKVSDDRSFLERMNQSNHHLTPVRNWVFSQRHSNPTSIWMLLNIDRGDDTDAFFTGHSEKTKALPRSLIPYDFSFFQRALVSDIPYQLCADTLYLNQGYASRLRRLEDLCHNNYPWIEDRLPEQGSFHDFDIQVLLGAYAVFLVSQLSGKAPESSMFTGLGLEVFDAGLEIDQIKSLEDLLQLNIESSYLFMNMVASTYALRSALNNESLLPMKEHLVEQFSRIRANIVDNYNVPESHIQTIVDRYINVNHRLIGEPLINEQSLFSTDNGVRTAIPDLGWKHLFGLTPGDTEMFSKVMSACPYKADAIFTASVDLKYLQNWAYKTLEENWVTALSTISPKMSEETLKKVLTLGNEGWYKEPALKVCLALCSELDARRLKGCITFLSRCCINLPTLLDDMYLSLSQLRASSMQDPAAIEKKEMLLSDLGTPSPQILGVLSPATKRALLTGDLSL